MFLTQDGGGGPGPGTWCHIIIGSLTPEILLCKIYLEFHSFSRNKSLTGTHMRKPHFGGKWREKLLCSIMCAQVGAAQSPGHWQTPSKHFSECHSCPS